VTGSALAAPSHQSGAQPGNLKAIKRGFYSRRFSNRNFYNRRFSNRYFCDRCLSGQEHLDLEFLVCRPIIRSSSFRDYFLLKNIKH
jgi:hypothetical protein